MSDNKIKPLSNVFSNIDNKQDLNSVEPNSVNTSFIDGLNASYQQDHQEKDNFVSENKIGLRNQNVELQSDNNSKESDVNNIQGKEILSNRQLENEYDETLYKTNYLDPHPLYDENLYKTN